MGSLRPGILEVLTNIGVGVVMFVVLALPAVLLNYAAHSIPSAFDSASPILSHSTFVLILRSSAALILAADVVAFAIYTMRVVLDAFFGRGRLGQR